MREILVSALLVGFSVGSALAAGTPGVSDLVPGHVEAMADLQVAQDSQATAEELWQGGESSMAKLLGTGAQQGSETVGGHVFPAEEVQGDVPSGLAGSGSRQIRTDLNDLTPPPPDDRNKKREEAAKKGEVLGWAAGGASGAVPGVLGTAMAALLPLAVLGAGLPGLVYGGLGLAAAMIGGYILIRKGADLGSRIGSKVGRAVGKALGWILYR